MKKVLLFPLIMLLLASCTSVHLPAPYSRFTIVDYSVFARNGIFVTESNSVNFDYTSIGRVDSRSVGGWVRNDGLKEPINIKEDYFLNPQGRVKNYQRPSLDEAFEVLIENMKKIGANGILNLKIETNSESIIVTGVAIKKM